MSLPHALVWTDHHSAQVLQFNAEQLQARTVHASQSLRLLAVNIYKDCNAFNRRHVLNELREAVRALGIDLLLLQEVEGGAGAAGAQHEFLAEIDLPGPP